MNFISMGEIEYTSTDSIDFIFVARYSHSNINKIVSATIFSEYFYKAQTDPCACGSYYFYGDLFARYRLIICVCEIVSMTQGFQWKKKKPPDKATHSWGYPTVSVQGRWNTELEIVIFEHWTTMEWYLTEETHKAHLLLGPKLVIGKQKLITQLQLLGLKI